MPTGAELKAQINVGITSQVDPDSITLGEQIGQPMEDIVDYVDQEIAALPTQPLRYKGLLSFTSGVFTFTPLVNTLGDGSGDGINDIAWSNPTPTNGRIIGTMTTAPFTTNKTVVKSTIVDSTSGHIMGYGWKGSASQARYTLVPLSGTPTTTPNFADMVIDIEVYP